MKSIAEVSDSIIARSKLLKIIVDVSQKYFTEISRYILGMDPQEHKILTVSLKNAGELVGRLSEGCKDLTLETLYKIYEDFSAAESYINDFMLLFNNPSYAKASLSEMSSGQHANMRADINRAITARDKYIIASRADDDITSSAIVVIKSGPKQTINEQYKFLSDNHAPNKLTFELIRKLLPVVMGDKLIFVTELINEQKQEILESSRADVGTHVATTPLQGHECVIYRYNLAPFTLSLHPRDLFKTLKWRWDESSTVQQNFQRAAQFGGNIIVISRVHGTPIEFDFRGVLDKTFAANLPVKPLGGLNKNFLARYNTTDILTDRADGIANRAESVSTDGTENVSTEAVSTDGIETVDSSVSTESVSTKTAGAETADVRSIQLFSPLVDTRSPVGFVSARITWNVIETIDGVHYRALGYRDSIDISGSRVLGLIMGTSTLPTEYNAIHAANIVRARGDMFDPVAPSHISRFVNHEKSIPASEPIKNTVVADLEKYVLSRVSDVHNNREWQNLFTADTFIAAVNEVIAAVLLKNSLIDKIKSPEYTITQIGRVNSIVAKFIKSVTRALSGEFVQDRMFSEYSRQDINTMLINRFSAIVKKAADLMDADKIWTGHELTLKEFIIAY
jgi:hypothetical protein